MFKFSKKAWNFKYVQFFKKFRISNFIIIFQRIFRISKRKIKICLNLCSYFSSFVHHSKTIVRNSKLFSVSKHMQAAKQSLSSACLDTYIAAKQQQLHGLIMSTLSMYERRTTRLGPYMLPNTPEVSPV